MKEQSHKDEMSAALRGDFQRLRDRGVPATLVPHEAAVRAAGPDAEEVAGLAEVSAPLADPPDDSQPNLPEPEETTTEGRASEQSAMPDEASDAPGREGAEEPVAARPGWLARLVGR